MREKLQYRLIELSGTHLILTFEWPTQSTCIIKPPNENCVPNHTLFLDRYLVMIWHELNQLFTKTQCQVIRETKVWCGHDYKFTNPATSIFGRRFFSAETL